jgi:xanthine/CO dehydrogenase XdhC/CoxF family maturation factor
MDTNPHFVRPASWREAASLLSFRPIVPANTEGFELRSLAVFAMDHNHRDIAVENRSLEAHFGGFNLSQRRASAAEARRLALDVSYGASPREALIAGHEARVCDLGPEPEPDDIDPRMPAVVTWHDDGMFFLVASGQLQPDVLLRIAASLYDKERKLRSI